MTEGLEDEDYQAFSAANGADGIRLNERENPDLIILDLRMPETDGIETLRQIRKKDDKVKVVILTGYGSPDTIRDAADLDVSEYLSKPFENDQLVRIISEVLYHQILPALAELLHGKLPGMMRLAETIEKAFKSILRQNDLKVLPGFQRMIRQPLPHRSR